MPDLAVARPAGVVWSLTLAGPLRCASHALALDALRIHDPTAHAVDQGRRRCHAAANLIGERTKLDLAQFGPLSSCTINRITRKNITSPLGRTAA